MRALLILILFSFFLHSSLVAVSLPMGPSESEGEDAEFATDASRPNAPASRLISNSVRSARDEQKKKAPAASGDFFGSLRLSTQYSRTSFDDNDVDSKGYVDERGFFITGDLSEATTLTLGYSRIKYRYGKFSPATSLLAHSYQASVHHSLNENYGIGGYGFYQEVDIENVNGNTYTYGGGLLFTTYHNLGPVQLSTSSTVTYVDYDTDDDLIVVLLADVSKDFTDWCGAGVNASWTDSLTDNANNSDDNYWTVGADVRFYWESFTLSVGYEQTLKLSDYQDNTLVIDLTYSF